MVDATEDAIHGRDTRGDELPEPLRRRQDRLLRIEEAKAALEVEAKAARSRVGGARGVEAGPPDAPPPPALPAK